MDIDTFFSLLFIAHGFKTPPFQLPFPKRAEQSGFSSSDWLNIIINLLLRVLLLPKLKKKIIFKY